MPGALSAADAAVLSDWARSEDSFRGEGTGGTLSGPAIEAAAVSYLFTKKSPREEEDQESATTAGEAAATAAAAAAVAAAAAATDGVDGGGKGGGGTDADADVGENPTTRASRAASFDSIGDVVVVGGLQLESHRVFAGDGSHGDDDWLASSHPSTPTIIPQVCRG